MSATTAELSFAEMLQANERETAKWQSWFERQPVELLDLPLDIALARNVSGSPVTEYEALPTGSVRDLCGIGERARELYREFLSRTTSADLAAVMEFPTRSAGVLRASKRKMFAHAMLHGVRHWAQLATALREKGHGTDWGHDFLFSEVML